MLLVAMSLTGCGENVSVSGHVTFEDDGKPVTAGKVVFVGYETLATGPLNKDGYYRLGTLKKKDGILPGTYKVYVECNGGIPVFDPANPNARPKVLHLSKDRSTEKSTDLKCEVEGRTVFDFTVTKGQEEQARVQ